MTTHTHSETLSEIRAPIDVLAHHLSGLRAQATAFRNRALARGGQFARKSSTNLSRAAFLALLAVPFLQPEAPPQGEVARSRVQLDVQIVHVPPNPVEAQKAQPAPAQASQSTPSPSSTAPKVDIKISPEGKPAETPQTEDPAKAEKAAPVLPPSAQPAPAWAQEQITAANKECDQLLAKVTLVAEPLDPVREGICGAPAPRLLKSLGDKSQVRFEPPLQLNCPMIAALNTWLTDKLQPAAQKHLGSPITRVIGKSYSCRNRYGLAKAPISEHAFMNAVDVIGFVLADGKTVKVGKSWGPTASELHAAAKREAVHLDKKSKMLVAASKLGAHDVAANGEDKSNAAVVKEGEVTKETSAAFLHEAHDDACPIFGTILGPDTNDAHHDHFHLDMKARKGASLCQ